MSIEEMKVLSGTLDECVRLHEDVSRCQHEYNCLLEQSQTAQKELDAETEDNNRLRKENANLRNQVTALIDERDDARRKLFELARFINFTVYTALDAAVKSKRCRAIVKDTVDAMLHFQNKNPITFMEGGVAK